GRISLRCPGAGHGCGAPVARHHSGLEAVLGADLEAAGISDQAPGLTVPSVIATVVLKVEGVEQVCGHAHRSTRDARKVLPQLEINRPIPPGTGDDEPVLRR